MASKAWEELVARYSELIDVSVAQHLMEWDQQVMMPRRGGGARARASAAIEGILHDRMTSPELGAIIKALEDDDSLDTDQAAGVRILRRDYDKATRVPEKLVRALAERRALAYQAWTRARPAADFSQLRPHLEELVALKKEEAEALGYTNEPYDALLDNHEPGATTAEIETMFEDLSSGLKPLAEAILEEAGPRPEWLARPATPELQETFCKWLVAQVGFDFASGRLDTSPHPFTIPIALGDVRQTTRTEPGALLNSVYAALHETGHALYEQRLPASLYGTPVHRVPSLGMHESQSRLWENQVGRSRSFTDFLLPKLKDRFAEVLGEVAPDEFHRGANHPERSLTRVNADEVTYNLHVVLRFEIELKLFRDELEAGDLPTAFNDAMERHLGITPPDDGTGVMQDMHWSMGGFGYFPTYTIGTLYAAAFYARAESELGSFGDDLRRGETSRLLTWLTRKIYEQGYRLPATELATEVAGAPRSATPFLDYLRAKYGAIYGRTF